jgi:hypothetical protein
MPKRLRRGFGGNHCTADLQPGQQDSALQSAICAPIVPSSPTESAGSHGCAPTRTALVGGWCCAAKGPRNGRGAFRSRSTAKTLAGCR